MKEKKRVYWEGFRYSNTPWTHRGIGITIEPRTVQPVSDELFEYLRHVRGFHTVDQVKSTTIDFIRPDFVGS